jgi:TolA-binding protein
VLPLPLEENEAEDALFNEDDEALQALLKEPTHQELQALGLVLPAEYQAVSKAFQETLEGLSHGNLKAFASKLGRLSEENPWHSLAEPSSFAAIASWHALKNCEEVLRVGTHFVQAWPHGALAAEVWLYMALCQKQSGRLAEFEETLDFLNHRYAETPAGLKAKIELRLKHPISVLE